MSDMRYGEGGRNHFSARATSAPDRLGHLACGSPHERARTVLRATGILLKEHSSPRTLVIRLKGW